MQSAQWSGMPTNVIAAVESIVALVASGLSFTESYLQTIEENPSAFTPADWIVIGEMAKEEVGQ